jgi:hypothetical protein
MESSLIITAVVAYVLGSIVAFFIGRNMGIKIGSVLTFDLFVRFGYVKYHIDERGEVVLEKITAGEEDRV